ncbi:hypothetical protein OE88DRAFT_1764747 [Heliocybe sulcata]|uniref:Uncharacterized protein n=1 Tax=Heliocybe sulcata TaxID=5364 RepID=A0A5C3NC25_9AGAM|nr:hypothetical protein OE88DRAFT_1764747 [Heliocybe sulcata]
MENPNSITFPRASSEARSTITRNSSLGDLSVMSRHATALEVCDLVYGEGDGQTSTLDAIEQFYEANAGRTYAYSPPVYENPLLTATSRSVLCDIYSLTNRLSRLNVPRPLVVLYTLLGKQDELEDYGARHSLFQALRVWTEVGEVSESESFDGHRQCTIEHTFNILILPGLHSDRLAAPTAGRFTHPNTPASSSLALPSSLPHPQPTDPALSVPLLNVMLPSPLHLQLHVITRLRFNDSGRITHHRDFWDVKDLLSLLPGGSVAQWVGARVVGGALSTISRVLGISARDEEDARKALRA